MSRVAGIPVNPIPWELIFAALLLLGCIGIVVYVVSLPDCHDSARLSDTPAVTCPHDAHSLHVAPVPSGGFLVNCTCHKADVVPVFFSSGAGRGRR